MVQLENDYTGADFSANIKAMNPSLLEGTLTGIFIGSYLQSITPRLALGLEAIWQRPAGGQGPETAISYAGRYKGSDWILSAQVLAQGGIQASYWKRLTDRAEAGVDMNLQFLGLSGAAGPMMGGMRNEGTATLGAKYDFRTATFRGQIDSTGKVSCVLEKRISQPVQVTFAGEMDHFKVRKSHLQCTHVAKFSSEHGQSRTGHQPRKRRRRVYGTARENEWCRIRLDATAFLKRLQIPILQCYSTYLNVPHLVLGLD